MIVLLTSGINILISWMVLNGIKLESIGYVILVCLWCMMYCNVVNNIDLMLSRSMYFTLTASKLWSCSTCFIMLVLPLWFTSINSSCPTGLPVVFMRICIMPSSGCLCHTPQTSSKCQALPQGACPVLQYLYLSLHKVSCVHFWVFCYMASKSLAFLMLFKALLWPLCVSILHAQVNMWSLEVASLFFNVATSLGISSVLPS